jgi:hypothetical protein
VVKARIIAHHVLEEFWQQLLKRPQWKQLLQELPEPVVHNLMNQALEPCHTGLDVTPKEIDDLMRNCSTIVARAVTKALHPDMNKDFASSFL